MEKDLKNSIASSTFLIMFLTSIGYCLSFIAQMLIAKYFGIGKELDAFVAASLVPEFVYGLTNAILFTPFIVLYPEYVLKKGEAKGKEFINKLFTTSFLILACIALFTIFFSSLIAKLIAPGFDAGEIMIVSNMLKFLSIAIVFFGLSSLTTAILYHEHAFLAPKLLRIALSGCIILAIFLFIDVFGSMSLVIGTILGIAVGFGVQYVFIKKKKYAFSFTNNFGDPSLKELLVLAWPLIISSFMYYATKSIANVIASTTESGSVSLLNYGFIVITLPIVFFSGSLTASVFPHMTKYSANQNKDGLEALFRKSVIMLLLVFVPLTCIFLLLGKDIIHILFERGEFTATSTMHVAKALSFFALGLIPSGIFATVMSVFYSMKRMKAQMFIYVLFLVIDVITTLFFVNYISYNGIALGMSLAYWIATIIAFYYITNAMGNFDYKPIALASIKIIIASGIMTAGLIIVHALTKNITAMFMDSLSEQIISSIHVALALLIAGVLYISVLKLWKLEEMSMIITTIKRQLKFSVEGK